jgi:hypothetical protein
MIHAILIVCHKVTSSLLHTVKEIESDPNTIGFIHVDEKISLEGFEFIGDISSVHMVHDRITVEWGGFSQIQATLLCMDYIISNFRFDYFSIISGEDFIYRGISRLNDHLVKQIDTEFIGVTSLNGVSSFEEERFKFVYKSVFFNRSNSWRDIILRKIYRSAHHFGLLKNPNNQPFVRMYKGSNWFTVSYSCVKYVLEFVRSNPHYIDYFKNSYCCDEIFFQSIVYNSDFKYKTSSFRNNCTDDNLMSLRIVDWKTGPIFPKVFSYSDLMAIKSDRTFLVRKVSDELSVCDLNRIADTRG